MFLSVSRRAGGAAFDYLQLHLHLARVSLDPATREWADQAREDIASGAVAKRVEGQPRPTELLRERRERSNERAPSPVG
jgi:hypothetical protein